MGQLLKGLTNITELIQQDAESEIVQMNLSRISQEDNYPLRRCGQKAEDESVVQELSIIKK